MKVNLAYGTSRLEIELPASNCWILEPRWVPGVANEFESLSYAIKHPIGSPPIAESLKPTDTVGIVFNDITRPTPNEKILPVIIDELRNSSIREENILLFNATGTHRQNNKAELRKILGDDIVNKYRIIQNDVKNNDTFVKIGTTQNNNGVLINKKFFKCKFHILTGFIEPHFFAGYSGGPKSIVPGMAALQTVKRNHSPDFLENPKAKWGITNGNPIWEELFEAAFMVPNIFIVNVALNREKKITRVFAGDMEKAHKLGCSYVQENAMLPVKEPFDIVITSNSGYPLDQDLYQSVKGLSAASQIIKKGGNIIIATECRNNIPNHGSFAKILNNAQSVDDLLEKARDKESPKADMWQVHVLGLILKKANVWVYSDGLTKNQIQNAKLKPCLCIEKLIQKLQNQHGNKLRIGVLPEGPQSIPYLIGHVGESIY